MCQCDRPETGREFTQFSFKLYAISCCGSSCRCWCAESVVPLAGMSSPSSQESVFTLRCSSDTTHGRNAQNTREPTLGCWSLGDNHCKTPTSDRFATVCVHDLRLHFARNIWVKQVRLPRFGLGCCGSPHSARPLTTRACDYAA